MGKVRPRLERWLALWTAAAAITTFGVVLLYLGPGLLPAGKGLLPLPFLADAPLVLIAIGLLGVLVGTVGIVQSRWRTVPAAAGGESSMQRRHGADAAAFGGLTVAAAALLIFAVIQVGWPSLQLSMRGGPCDQDPTVACFRAHPDFYQEVAPGNYSTPVSRLGNIVGPIELAAWPVALGAAITSVIALASGTRRRRMAILGVILGSITVVGMAAQYFAFLILGGGD